MQNKYICSALLRSQSRFYGRTLCFSHRLNFKNNFLSKINTLAYTSSTANIHTMNCYHRHINFKLYSCVSYSWWWHFNPGYPKCGHTWFWKLRQTQSWRWLTHGRYCCLYWHLTSMPYHLTTVLGPCFYPLNPVHNLTKQCCKLQQNLGSSVLGNSADQCTSMNTIWTSCHYATNSLWNMLCGWPRLIMQPIWMEAFSYIVWTPTILHTHTSGRYQVKVYSDWGNNCNSLTLVSNLHHVFFALKC